jgi:hypothetical protein
MNKLILTALFLMSGCGGATECDSSPLLGSWVDENVFIYTFTSSCVFTINTCDLDGTFEHETQGPNGGIVNVDIKSSDGVNCLGVGKHTCEYVIDTFEGETAMAYDCGQGIIYGIKI